MTAVDVADAALTDFELASEVVCHYKGCDNPANNQVRMHLRNSNGAPGAGCSTRTVMLCQAHTDRILAQARAAAPKWCTCGILRDPSDIVLWVRPLR